MPERITSRANPVCTHFRKLASSRAYREKTGEFLCDSPKLLREACHSLSASGARRYGPSSIRRARSRRIWTVPARGRRRSARASWER